MPQLALDPHDLLDRVRDVAVQGKCPVSLKTCDPYNLEIKRWCPLPKFAVITDIDIKVLSLVMGKIINSVGAIDRNDFYIGVAARCVGMSDRKCDRCKKWLLADLLVVKPRLTLRVNSGYQSNKLKLVKEKWGHTLDISDPVSCYNEFNEQMGKVNDIVYQLISPF